MESQENNNAGKADNESPGTVDSAQQPEANEAARGGLSRWREVFHQAFEKARQSQRPVASLRELNKDKSKSLILLAIAVVVVALLFLGIFSSPNQLGSQGTGRPGAPNLGRRLTPGDVQTESGTSVTPLLDADVRANQSQSNGALTPEDIGRTARPRSSASSETPSAAPGTPSVQNESQYALGRVDFSDPALRQQPGYGVGPAYEEPPKAAPTPKPTDGDEQLRKPSLIFVRSVSAGGSTTRVSAQSAPVQQFMGGIDLPPGTRLVARLESPASTAVKQPVVAIVEYNYERNGEIVVPAGSRAVGELRQAERNGIVDIKFDSLAMPYGVAEKLDGVAMGLDFKPLKGNVAGKNTGTRFLVRAFTGLGTAASYLVGNGGSAGFYGPISQSALLRERIANNLGVAGEQELNALAVNQNIVVTVPGNTRFYIVIGNMESISETGSRPAELAAATPRSNLPSLDELRQLMQLRQELSAMYQQTSTLSAPADAAQQ